MGVEQGSHDVGAATDRADGQTPSDDLAHRDDVRLHAQRGVRAVESEPQAVDLVKDEQSAAGLEFLANHLQERRARRFETEVLDQGVDHDASQPVTHRAQDAAPVLDIVHRQHDHIGRQR